MKPAELNMDQRVLYVCVYVLVGMDEWMYAPLGLGWRSFAPLHAHTHTHIHAQASTHTGIVMWSSFIEHVSSSTKHSVLPVT